MMVGNHVMVPVRGVFEHMNTTLNWDEPTQTIFAMHGADSIKLTLNTRNAVVNGRTVPLDSPAMMYQGRTMVPLRFLSESLNASVNWLADTRTVEITTAGGDMPNVQPLNYNTSMLVIGSVIPFTVNKKLSSDGSVVGERFKATLDSDSNGYGGLPRGTMLEGHVDVAKAMVGTTPGVLGLSFDRVRLPDGQSYAIYGELSGLDSKSVDNVNGTLTAKSGAQDNLKFVGLGAGGGALVAILTKGNLITNSLIGAALGFLVDESQRGDAKPSNVSVVKGAKFGVRLTRDLSFRVPKSVAVAELIRVGQLVR